jgi:hypothetical protein
MQIRGPNVLAAHAITSSAGAPASASAACAASLSMSLGSSFGSPLPDHTRAKRWQVHALSLKSQEMTTVPAVTIPAPLDRAVACSPANHSRARPIPGLALPDPAEAGLHRQRWRQVLAVAPVAAAAVLVPLGLATWADHDQMSGSRDQAALARRMRRRRSEDLSSSFRPPQVPYFSGLLTA